MLNIFRSKKFARRTLLGILILIIPAFVLWGSGSNVSSPQPIGTIGGKDVSVGDFEKSIQGVKIDLIFKFYGDYDTFGKLWQNKRLVNELAWNKLIEVQAAKQKNIKVNDRDVMIFLSSVPLFQRDGSFDQTMYLQIIRNNFGLEPRQFEELIREYLMVQLLLRDLFQGITVDTEKLKADHIKAASKVSFSYVFFETEKAAKDIAVSPEEVKNYYDSHKSEFLSDLKSEIEYVSFPYDDIDKKASAVSRADDFSKLARRTPKQFVELASKTDGVYGKSQAITKNDILPGIKYSESVYSAAFSLKPGDISVPVFGDESKGYVYIFHKMNDLLPKQLTQEEAYKSVEGIIKGRKAMEAAAKKAADLYERISDGKMTLEDAAKAGGLSAENVKDITIDDYIVSVGAANSLVGKALLMKAGETIAPMELSKGAIVARIDSIRSPDDASFEEKKQSLSMSKIMELQTVALKKWFAEKAPKAELKRDLGSI
jgi:parvulin-like peptidyl-prolyl isomerase